MQQLAVHGMPSPASASSRQDLFRRAHLQTDRMPFFKLNALHLTLVSDKHRPAFKSAKNNDWKSPLLPVMLDMHIAVYKIIAEIAQGCAERVAAIEFIQPKGDFSMSSEIKQTLKTIRAKLTHLGDCL
jgi:hypothetical protein